jgi:hypothetical protein
MAPPILPAALIAGHPGHELRLFHWLETARPLVCIITDGSGAGHSRVASSRQLIAATGSTPGPVIGAVTDVALYDAMMRCDITSAASMTAAISRSLVEQGIRSVVADEFEFYNPTHDLCAVIASLASMRAQATTGRVIDRYDYAVTTAALESGIVIDLDEETLKRKIATAYAFDHLTSDVNDLLATVGVADLAREVLRPVSGHIELPPPVRKPFYETHGEERVREGRYRAVFRYTEHFVPFVQELAAEFGCSVVEAERAPSA